MATCNLLSIFTLKIFVKLQYLAASFNILLWMHCNIYFIEAVFLAFTRKLSTIHQKFLANFFDKGARAILSLYFNCYRLDFKVWLFIMEVQIYLKLFLFVVFTFDLHLRNYKKYLVPLLDMKYCRSPFLCHLSFHTDELRPILPIERALLFKSSDLLVVKNALFLYFSSPVQNTLIKRWTNPIKYLFTSLNQNVRNTKYSASILPLWQRFKQVFRFTIIEKVIPSPCLNFLVMTKQIFFIFK